jgi:hypothetical protein
MQYARTPLPDSLNARSNEYPLASSAEQRTNRRGVPLIDGVLDGAVWWGWACRGLDPENVYQLSRDANPAPRPGDVAVVRVRSVNNHTRLTQADHMRLRLYPGVTYVGVFGNRYATSSIEAEVKGTEDLHQLTGAGMIGTFRSVEKTTKGPTKLEFVGYVTDAAGQRVNLKDALFEPHRVGGSAATVVLVLGSGMNTGKTAVAAKLSHNLTNRGRRVAACKLTGSVSRRDYYEMSATGAVDVRDFSDYGFPSTYLCEEQEIIDLFHTMVADAAAAEPDVLVMEVADGILQRETQMLLGNASVRGATRAVVLSAPCAPSALMATHEIEEHGYTVTTVSGLITNSPLFMREFTERSRVPLSSSAGDGAEVAMLIAEHLRAAEPHSPRSAVPSAAD